MRKSDFYYDSQSQSWTKFLNLTALIVFCFTVTTFSVFEISNFYADKDTVSHILKDNIKHLEAAVDQTNDNNENGQQQTQVELLNPLYSERQARAAAENSTQLSTQKSNNYYEEQRPVVVYSRTDVESPIALRQMAEVPPKQDTEDDDTYGKAYDDGYEDSDDDYFGQSESTQTQSSPHFGQEQQQRAQALQPNYRQQPSYYRPPSTYYDDSREYNPDPRADQPSSQEARATQYHDRNNYYRPYSYATATPASVAGVGNAKRYNVATHNRQMTSRNQAQQQQYGEPYPAYDDDYEYLSPNSQAAAAAQPFYSHRNLLPQRPQYRTPSTPKPAEENAEAANQMDFLTMFKSIKTMWDLYQSFTSSWNTIAEKRNREEELAKQKFKQQQMRINSRKPPKFAARKNTTAATTKGPKKQVTTTAATATVEPKVSEMYPSAEDEADTSSKKPSLAKVEPRKGFEVKAHTGDGIRDKRQAAAGKQEASSVAEGRYIKGDPLKGYYDFVITEGSYKFWAAFQVGTAILIIYSTFAAIYYSKVNPLVSDYDYTDYLGGGRSLSGGDLDFVDDVDEAAGENAKTKRWFEWLPRTGHSLKFILEAIDKLPTDHAEDREKEETYYKTNGEVKDNSSAEYANNEAEPETKYSNLSKTEQNSEHGDFLENLYSPLSTIQDHAAM